MTTAALTIEPLRIPESVDAPDARDWNRYVEIANAVQADDARTDLLRGDPAVWLAKARDQRYDAIHLWVARGGDGEILGVANLQYDRSTDREALLLVAVDPARRDLAVERRLLDFLEEEARALGRTLVTTWTTTAVDLRAEPEDRVLRPATGAGAIDPRDPRVQAMIDAGYRLSQVERASVFDLDGPTEPLREVLAAALAEAGPEYETAWWPLPTPEHLRAGYAAAIARMSTDVPAGELEIEQAVWDADRVRERDLREIATGRTWGITAVIHRPTGEVAAFNEIVADPDRSATAHNYGTLVMPEHRGHRLGTVVKCLGLLRWKEEVPESPCVVTFNAEENRFMLDVNERVGFRPLFWEADWQKTLA
ncbi:GNAT family N-acetyltransferase [Microbacterium indicum]|uniref:GNAT family N-acetyltransferase n=1 Tax=Microbacterium indicum TaxID=358100 RepID=UPI00040811A3|nr:GNAT family N-acetyltransferase [Microbacterium indicum]